MLKVSAFYLEKQKSFIPKKILFRPLSISKQKSFVYFTDPIFSEGFELNYELPMLLCTHGIFFGMTYGCSGLSGVVDMVR